jgi:hypothetical protein
MQPDPRHTVIMTQTVKASELFDPQQYGPIFIDDNEPQRGLDGRLAHFARKIVRTDHHFGYFGSSLGGEPQITVKFADGTPDRVFDLDDDVVIHNILPGTDLSEARPPT